MVHNLRHQHCAQASHISTRRADSGWRTRCSQAYLRRQSRARCCASAWSAGWSPPAVRTDSRPAMGNNSILAVFADSRVQSDSLRWRQQCWQINQVRQGLPRCKAPVAPPLYSPCTHTRTIQRSRSHKDFYAAPHLPDQLSGRARSQDAQMRRSRATQPRLCYKGMHVQLACVNSLSLSSLRA